MNKNLERKNKASPGHSPCGFTLIEILLVVSVLSVVGVAVYHVFSDSLKVWSRAQSSLTEEDVSIFSQKITSDVRNAFMYSKIRFEGKEDSLAFAAIIRTPADIKSGLAEGSYVNQIGKVEYYFDDLKNGLYRRQANYSQALGGKTPAGRLLVSDIKSVKFQYYYRHGSTYEVEAQGRAIIPSAVSVDLELGDGENPKRIVKFINIPAGN